MMDRIRLEIENPRQLRSGLHARMVITRRGAIIGASEETDWVLQDNLNTIADFVARFEFTDDQVAITTFPGANVHVNGSTSSLRPNRRVLLREDDIIGIGHLNLRIREAFLSDEDVDYFKLDDAVDISSRVMRNDGYRGFVDAQVIDVVPQNTFTKSAQDWTKRKGWEGRDLVDTQANDPLMHVGQKWDEWTPHDDVETVELNDRVLMGERSFQGSLVAPSQPAQRKETGKPISREFLDFNSSHVDNPSNRITRDAKNHDADKDKYLMAIAKSFGVSLEELSPDALPNVFSEMSEAFGAIVDNHKTQHSAPKAAFQDSLEQLGAHQAATEAGIGQGLKSILEILTPENLEQQFENDAPKGKQARAAFFWRNYKTYYKESVRPQNGGLGALFWKVFQETYQKSMGEENNPSKLHEKGKQHE